MDIKSIVREFISALDEEIDAIKRGKGGNVIRIFNGRFIRKISDLCFGLREAEKCL